ncbi:1,4-alpha-glucan branching enzyme [Orenia metallireducens]|uniref:1,4-alpha-glucan branching enzyme GlgB n=1 Tax=Orenia metallireducens TaxID=1413210 RepID=A0A285F3A4_9FIRM|nr:1,4-alpha-glucan branching protein GlgB [Orenia metallireducens]SNY05745.1 1,4-alpha-glucan branching enzyme [Orenia metallireducens]
MATLNEYEMNLVLNAQTKDPAYLLGMHQLAQDKVVVRAFEPHAEKIFLKSDQFEEEIELELVHGDGLFEKVFQTKEFFDYKLKYRGYHGGEWERRDPYSFIPYLSDYDLYLFSEGNHHRVYEKMGAHIVTHQGVEGTVFTVWAPEAERVSVIGNFNSWDGRVHQMRLLGHSGVWEIFIPSIGEGEVYRFEILTKEGYTLIKSDPYAFYSELRPANASIVYDYNGKYEWEDDKWMEKRAKTSWLERPMSVYEVNLGSWARVPEEENRFLSYRELADKLVEYVKKHNYTHVELMPVAEHPLDESWGYQVTGYFAVTSRFGKPEDLMYLIDQFHKNDIGVILDWVPGHFPKDAHGLGRFDGSAVYEHLDPRLGEHQDWGTYIFNYGRNEVKNFLISNALYWLDKFHIDGLRVDAVASMIYLDYSREGDQWVPNKYGGRENLEAIEFLQYFNSISHEYYPGILTIAEESTAFEGVSRPTYLGGLGFSMKWNMGWMNDALEYIEKDPIYRKYHHNNLTFPLVYAFNENFMLVLSHDEVVHGKGSMINKMPGDYWQKFANLRAFYAYMYAHPGKNLTFMGGEFGQWKEWNATQSLDWNLLDFEAHQKLLDFMTDLNGTYQEQEALWEIDFNYDGFEWIDCHDADNSILSFMRKAKNPDEFIIAVFNFTPIERNNYRIGVPREGYYEEILNSNAGKYWGSNSGNMGGAWSEAHPWQNRGYSINITLPPLSGLYFKYKR